MALVGSVMVGTLSVVQRGDGTLAVAAAEPGIEEAVRRIGRRRRGSPEGCQLVCALVYSWRSPGPKLAREISHVPSFIDHGRTTGAMCVLWRCCVACRNA
jgi:hypothetical protein